MIVSLETIAPDDITSATVETREEIRLSIVTAGTPWLCLTAQAARRLASALDRAAEDHERNETARTVAALVGSTGECQKRMRDPRFVCRLPLGHAGACASTPPVQP